MEITDKINYVLGKTVVYMLLIIYPFVMHNKLNDVTLTRFFFFIIVSYVGFLVLCINSLASFILKRVSDKKKYDDDNVDFINIQEGAYSAESQIISKVYDIKDKIKNMDLWKKLIFLFLFVCIMSYLFSPYKSVAFLGHGGRYTGLVFYGACVCIMLFQHVTDLKKEILHTYYVLQYWLMCGQCLITRAWIHSTYTRMFQLP